MRRRWQPAASARGAARRRGVAARAAARRRDPPARARALPPAAPARRRASPRAPRRVPSATSGGAAGRVRVEREVVREGLSARPSGRRRRSSPRCRCRARAAGRGPGRRAPARARAAGGSRRRRRRSPGAARLSASSARFGAARSAPRRSRARSDAARSAARRVVSSGPRSRTLYSSAVFRPANEKSSPATRAPVGNSNAVGSPVQRQLRQRRPARVAEPEQPRALVERLARGVVERLAQRLVAARGRRPAPAACGRREASRQMNGGSNALPRKFAATWPCRWSTGGQRQPPRRGQALGRRHADQQRAHQPGPLGDRDQLDVVQRRSRLSQRQVDDRVDVLEVMA